MPNVQLFPGLLERVNWLNFPPVPALDPRNPDTPLQLRVAGSTLIQLYRSQRRTALWQGWAHLVGTSPPIPNTSVIRATIPPSAFGSLVDPAACFRGINRPHLQETNGDSVYVYILNPSHTLQWHSSMVCVAKLVSVPPNTVLAIYVRLTDALQIGNNDIGGAITGWEFIPADERDPLLPEGYRTRYIEEVWRR